MPDIVADLVGPDVKFHHSKLNFKWMRGGEEVKWHYDISFWPHTNYSPLTIGTYLYDCGMEQGPLAVLPKSHLLDPMLDRRIAKHPTDLPLVLQRRLLACRVRADHRDIDVELHCDVRDDVRRHLVRHADEHTEEPHRAQLQGEPQPIRRAAATLNELPIRAVQQEEPSELRRRGRPVEPPEHGHLMITPEPDWHAQRSTDRLIALPPDPVPLQLRSVVVRWLPLHALVADVDGETALAGVQLPEVAAATAHQWAVTWIGAGSAPRPN